MLKIKLSKQLFSLENKAHHATTCLCNTNTLTYLEHTRPWDLIQATEEEQDLFFDKIHAKLEHIIGSWFGLDVFYTDNQGRIQFLAEKDYPFKSTFLKLQMSHAFGHEWLESDVEKVFEKFNDHEEHWLEFESFFPNTWSFAHKVMVDGELQGMIFAYPYFKDNCTREDEQRVVQKLKQ